MKRFSKAMTGMDDVCANIYVILIGKKSLRINELYRALSVLAGKISKETLYIHLKHLEKEGFIKREIVGKQNVSWVLNKEHPVEKHHAETVERWIDSLKNWQSKKSLPHLKSGLPPRPRWKPLTEKEEKEHYEKLPEHQLDSEIDADIREALLANLYELKCLVDYDLKSDSDFWKIIGNPLYKLFEKSVAENCRVSDRYRKKFLEKIDSQIQQIKAPI